MVFLLKIISVFAFVSLFISCKTDSFELAAESFGSDPLIKGDSLLFLRGHRYFVNIDLTADSLSGIRYIGAYGDTLLPNPILDGSIYRFDFNASEWDDFEVINGVKFYKKIVEGLEQVENVYADEDMLTLARKPNLHDELVTGQKNSFKGYFKIDSVDVKEPRTVFFDRDNLVSWAGGEIVTKTQLWSYEVRTVESSSNGRLVLSERLQDPFRKDWGYFVQRHKNALDSEGEWYYDERSGVLYFSPLKDKCMIYISSNRNNKNAGIEIQGGKDITIQDLRFVNYKFGILAEGTKSLRILDNEFENCIYGVINKSDYLENCIVEGNSIINMRSFGIKVLGNNTLIKGNTIENTGMTLGAESRGYNNLCAIDIRGYNNSIINNYINNTGYSGIRFFGTGPCLVYGNRVENTMQIMSDGGALYTWRYMDGNSRKIIRKNTVLNAFGNAGGTTGNNYHARGIYLDELSLHFRVDSNYVSESGDGIYLQNSRSDTVVFNRTENNKISEFHINHGGTILNGGKLNPENDPGFDPELLDNIPEGYVWNEEEQILYYKNWRRGVVYVRPGNNLVRDNVFIPSNDRNAYSFRFRTWQHLTDETIEILTGNDDFFYNNIPDSLVKNAALFLQASNVRDMNHKGKDFTVVENRFTKSKFDYLRRIYIWIGRGVKNNTESPLD